MKILRHLPSVHHLKEHPRFSELAKAAELSTSVLTDWLGETVDIVRQQILTEEIAHDSINRERLIEFIFDELNQKVILFHKDNLQSVINATGVILHTNLGRARLSKQAIEQITNVAENYSTLEYDMTTGGRGSRHDLVEEYIKQLTGAEAAIVVNNNAAAVYLVLKSIAAGQEVIVSRGELVEIGGSFRISEIMEQSEAELVSVGTSNKTYVADYERAITEETALLLKVHKSNFKLVGFTADVETDELMGISKKYQIPIYEDLGSGTLFDFSQENIGTEPTVQEKVQSGIDLISFSGDKLLGGPQAGIIVGKKEYIEEMKRHQLARVLRVDKFTLAGLESTLKTYLRGQEQREIPTIRDITTSSKQVKEKAHIFLQKLNATTTSFTCQIESDYSQVGGGTMPGEQIDTYIVSVTHDHYSSMELAERLRKFEIPIIVRVKNEAVILDFRTVERKELAVVVEAFTHIEG